MDEEKHTFLQEFSCRGHVEQKSLQSCKKSHLDLAICQNWCFGQFYHSRIEVLQNYSASFLSAFLMKSERTSKRIERNFKTQNLSLGNAILLLAVILTCFYAKQFTKSTTRRGLLVTKLLQN